VLSLFSPSVVIGCLFLSKSLDERADGPLGCGEPPGFFEHAGKYLTQTLGVSSIGPQGTSPTARSAVKRVRSSWEASAVKRRSSANEFSSLASVAPVLLQCCIENSR
jgi:hypothetical protein